MVLRILLTWLHVSPTGLSPSSIGFPTPFGYTLSIVRRSPYPAHISICGLASFAFARHYSRNLGWFLFLWVLRCFSSPRSPLEAMYSLQVSRFFTVSVSTFGNLRIEAYLQLPAAYRSLSRPSSAPDAKAFTLCSYSLELPFIRSLELVLLNCLSFFLNKCFWFFLRSKKVWSFLRFFRPAQWSLIKLSEIVVFVTQIWKDLF